MKTKQRIGIFGGCFNPPHKMHENIGLDLIKNGYLDKVIYVPVNDKYQKLNLISNKHRFNMLNILFQDNLHILISNYEFTKLTYTYKTLDYFQSLYPDSIIYFICGIDNLKELTTWRNYEYILSHYKLLVVSRNNISYPEILNKYPQYQSNIILASITPQNISSTMIRNALSKKDYQNKILTSLNPQVLNYIIKNKLYKE